MNGKEKFIDELKQLNFNPESKDGNRVAFNYSIKDGRFKDQAIQIGLEIPQDYPVNPPPGPHITPALIPVNGTSTDNAKAVTSPAFGNDWLYLSRPFRDNQAGWNRTHRDARSYLKHIKNILDTL